MRTLLISCIMMLTSIASWGAKAYPGPYVYTQPDGTQISLTLHGDEYFSYFTTSDGVIVVREKSGVYLAKIDENGDITSTGVLAHSNGLRTAEEIEIIKTQNINAFFKTADEKSRARRVPIASVQPPYTPHLGSPRILVILAEFQDVKFTINEPQKAFNDFFNADGVGSNNKITDYGNENKKNYGSIARYFKDMSNGAFTPQFEIVGPVTLGRNVAYYGGSSQGGGDERRDDLVKDAIKVLKDQGFDFSKSEFDIDRNNQIDLVYVIYAGYMQNMGGPNSSIWASSSSIDIDVSKENSKEEKRVRRYSISGEKMDEDRANRIASIGVTCHEISHCLGLPDLYVTSDCSQFYNDNQEMEFWDLMDGGENINHGYWPAAYTAWEKEAMGWTVNFQDLGEDNVRADFSTSTLNNGTVYRIVNPADKSEYIILENIRKSGWNYGAYVAEGTNVGVLAYHMKYNQNAVGVYDYPNCRKNPGLAVIPADGLLESYDFIDKTIDGRKRTQESYTQSLKGDLFNPVNGTVLSDEMKLPNFCWYRGTDLIDGYSDRYKTNKYVSLIFDGNNISINYIADAASGISNVKATETDSKAYYSINGQYLGADKGKLKPGIYFSNKKKVIIR